MASFNPTPTKPIVSYPTASIEELQLITIHDSRLAGYTPLPYGSPYPDQDKFPGLQLVFQGPIGEDDRLVRRIWAGDRGDQDIYNDSRKYSGGSTDHPIIIRKYILPEGSYTPLQTGTPDHNEIGAFLVDEEVTRPENLNGYLAVTRVFESLPGPALTGYVITNDGQLAVTKSQSVLPGATVTPSALLISGSVKPDSKGKSVLETIEVPIVFGAKSYSIEAPDPAPPKFRVAVPATTTWETVAGTATAPVLATGEIESSEQQATVFTKKLRKTSRATPLSKTLTQTATTNDGIKATITETYQTGDDTLTARSALVSVESDALGDGTFVVKKTELASVFDQQAKSAQKPDVIPERYRASASAKTTTSISPDATAVSDITLGTNELEKSIQRVSEFTKKTSVTSRDNGTLPTLTGQDYDASIGAVVPYTEKITTTGDTLIGALSDVSPLSSDYKLVRTIDTTNLTAALSAISLQFPSRATLSIPPVLESIEVVWDQTTDNGSYASDWTGYAYGTSTSLSGSERAEAKGASSLTPSFVIKMKDTWATNIPTSTHVFFLPTPCTEAHILTALGKKYSSGTVINRWPVFKPKSDTVVAFGTKVSVTVEGNASASHSVSNSNNSWDSTQGTGSSTYSSTTTVVANIPSCIHPTITITGAAIPTVKAATAKIDAGWVSAYNFPVVNVSKSETASATGKVSPTTLPATAQTAVPSTGYYLIDSRVELYQHGYVKVYAEVLDASVLA